MFSLSLNFNRHRITKIAFSLFMIFGILNWTFTPNILTYADEEVTQPVVEAVTPEPIPAPIEPEAETEPVLTTETETGDAVASTDIVNEVNVNEVNSEGEILVVGDSLEDSSLDLRGILGTTTASTTCGDCTASTTVITNITNQNTATVTNEIIVNANTGENVATSTATSTISTGDAYAGANVVNIVNTNIVDSKYFLLVFNNFGDWSGDLVLPNGNFFNNFLASFNPDCGCNGSTNIANTNDATVDNLVQTSANTGENHTSGENSAINTGNSLASANIYNLINTNVYNNSSFYLLVKVFGDWNGDIFNLPEGIAWQNTPEGIVLYNEGNDPFQNNGSDGSVGNLNLENNNSAHVTNDLNVTANTGENAATSTEAVIQTGDAYAGANVVNIVNTNIVSSNWMRALVNIFGDWDGNISFGQPDLWVGTVANVEGKAEAGSTVFFTTTIKNNGDARATNINFLAKLRSSYFKFIPSYSDWHQYEIEVLEPGESREFSFTGMIDRYASNHEIVIDSFVNSFETDNSEMDNIDRISFVATYNPGAIILPQKSFSTSYPDLSVTKTHTIPSSVVIDEVEMVPTNGKVDYKIVIKNDGGSAYDAILFDELKDESGKVANRQYWELGEILPNEEITITYTTEFNENSAPGIYTNRAWVEAVNKETIVGLEKKADSNVASDQVVLAQKPIFEIKAEALIAEPIAEVLGLFTENIEILREEVNQEDTPKEFEDSVGGFCFEENKKENPLDLNTSRYALLSLSFILVIQKREGVSGRSFIL